VLLCSASGNAAHIEISNANAVQNLAEKSRLGVHQYLVFIGD
jgi:hypothetical protein